MAPSRTAAAISRMRSLPSGRRRMRPICQTPYTMARTAHASAKTRPLCILFAPLESARILSGQCSENPGADFIYRSGAGDLAVLRRLRIARGRPLAVVIDERPRLLAVDLETLSHRVLAVVVALHQRLAGDVVETFSPRRIEFHMVAAAGGWMDAPAAHARDDLFVRNFDPQHVIEIDVGGLHGFGLRDGAREAVEEISLGTIGLPEPLLHQTDDDVIGHQLPGVHHLLRGESERRTRLHRGAQHVAGGD